MNNSNLQKQLEILDAEKAQELLRLEKSGKLTKRKDKFYVKAEDMSRLKAIAQRRVKLLLESKKQTGNFFCLQYGDVNGDRDDWPEQTDILTTMGIEKKTRKYEKKDNKILETMGRTERKDEKRNGKNGKILNTFAE